MGKRAVGWRLAMYLHKSFVGLASVVGVDQMYTYYQQPAWLYTFGGVVSEKQDVCDTMFSSKECVLVGATKNIVPCCLGRSMARRLRAARFTFDSRARALGFSLA